MPKGEVTVTENQVWISPGYIENKIITIPEAGALTVSGNKVTVPVGYIKDVRTAEIPVVSATLTDNKVTIPAGYNNGQTLTVAEATAPTTSGNVVTVNKGYQAAQKKITVGTAKAAETITPGTADKTIAADTYLTGALTVKGDANWTEENIADGVSMWGKVGTFKGGGGTSFYKCASVDTSAKTWTGYKAVLADGVYSFEEIITEGLIFSSITPEVGKVYTADALAEIKNLYDGSDPTMVFYAPLSKATATAETGQTLTENGTIQYSDGWVTIDPNSYIEVSDKCNFGTQWSFSTNFKFSGGGVAWLFSSNVGNPDTNMRLVLLDSGAVETTVIGGSDGRMASNKTYADGKPHCIVWTGDSGTTKLYVDGEQVGSASYYGTQSIGVVIGGIYRGSASAQQRGVRFYNRVLSDAEITELANEFSPTA
jgi:hypothetical protein